MTHHHSDDPHEHPERANIIRPDAAHLGVLRQFGNGIGGIAVLMLTGVLLIVMVFWKTR